MITDEFRKTWVDALRSGEYEQGTGSLCTGDKYCCIGLAAELHPEVDFVEYGRAQEYDPTVLPWKATLDVDGGKCSGLLPQFQLDKLSLSDVAQDRLATKNDNGATFAEIADIIESGHIISGGLAPIAI